MCALIAATTIKAYKIPSMSKPVPNSTSRPIPTRTTILPEERRKLSIFPKKSEKYVVTSQPYAKVRTYTPRPTNSLLTKRQPIYEKPASKMLQNTVTSNTISPVGISMSAPVQQVPQKIVGNLNNNYIAEPIEQVTEKSSRDLSSNKKMDYIGEEPEEISTDIPEIDAIESEKTMNGDQVDFNAIAPDLDSVRIKRLAVGGPSLHDSWNAKTATQAPTNTFYEDDENEYIFVKDKEKNHTNDHVQKNTLSKLSEGTGRSETEMKNRLKRYQAYPFLLNY